MQNVHIVIAVSVSSNRSILVSEKLSSVEESCSSLVEPCTIDWTQGRAFPFELLNYFPWGIWLNRICDWGGIHWLLALYRTFSAT